MASAGRPKPLLERAERRRERRVGDVGHPRRAGGLDLRPSPRRPRAPPPAAPPRAGPCTSAGSMSRHEPDADPRPGHVVDDVPRVAARGGLDRVHRERRAPTSSSRAGGGRRRGAARPGRSRTWRAELPRGVTGSAAMASRCSFDERPHPVVDPGDRDPPVGVDERREHLREREHRVRDRPAPHAGVDGLLERADLHVHRDEPAERDRDARDARRPRSRCR